MRTRIFWSERARADIRALERDTAMRIFETLLRFAQSGDGDVRKLQGERDEFRLRVGNYRIRFTEELGTLVIHSVRHRKDAYR